jgi:hypothetical protein
MTPFILLLTLLTAPPLSAAGPPILPYRRLTPGAANSVSEEDLCQPGFSKWMRAVSEKTRLRVYREYQIPGHTRGEFEVEHLIPLALGGSNDIANLVPESYQTQPWNAHVKDRLEKKLHDMVCAGEIDLQEAQKEIASNWIETYERIFHTDQPSLSARGSTSRASRSPVARVEARTTPAPDVPPSAGQVWVNTRSGKYFRPGSRYYGNTLQGHYMNEQDALRAGFIAAKV